MTNDSGLREKIAERLSRFSAGLPDEDLALRLTAGEARTLLALISPAGEVEGWQPIETAPQDGTAFLGYFDGRVFVTEWDTTFRMWTDYFTHWMPLPAAPRGMEG